MQTGCQFGATQLSLNKSLLRIENAQIGHFSGGKGPLGLLICCLQDGNNIGTPEVTFLLGRRILRVSLVHLEDDGLTNHFVLSSGRFELCLGARDAATVLIEDRDIDPEARSNFQRLFTFVLPIEPQDEVEDIGLLPAQAFASGFNPKFSRPKIRAGDQRRFQQLID